MNECSAEELKWQKQFRSLVLSGDELRRRLLIQTKNDMSEPLTNFSCRVPTSFVDRMEKNNPLDPLFLQVFPQALELKEQEGFVSNPLKEAIVEDNVPILKKYQGRALWLISNVCAVHCRYCFRRETDFSISKQGSTNWDKIIKKLGSFPDLKEVILSGGDPLSLPTRLITDAVQKLQELSNLHAIRIHTRLPIVLPARITQELCLSFAQSKIPIVVVVHCNHPNEINEEVTEAILKLKKANVLVLNQSVLLKNVNDNAETLVKLSEKLFKAGVQPYYLNLLDQVKGSSHFQVTLAQARKIMQDLIQKTSGYLVPKLVQETPDGKSKIPVDLQITSQSSSFS